METLRMPLPGTHHVGRASVLMHGPQTHSRWGGAHLLRLMVPRLQEERLGPRLAPR